MGWQRPMAIGCLVAAVVAPAVVAPATASAQGQRRTAIVNLAEDQAAGQLAAEGLRARLEKHPNLRPLRPGLLARSLEDALAPDTRAAAVVVRARTLLAKGKTELSAFRSSRALAAVRDAEAMLLDIAPSPEQQVLLADLAFFAGRVHLREQNRGLARSSFELALRLVKDFPAPDPGRFNPDIVETFVEARASVRKRGGGTLEVSATFDGTAIYVDGKVVGNTPLAIAVASGAHYVVAVSPEHRINARRVDVGDGDAVSTHFELAQLSRPDSALLLRSQAVATRIAVGGPRLEALARSLQTIANTNSAIVIRGRAGNLELAAFRTSSRRGTRFRSFDGEVDSVLALLSPVRPLRPEELFSASSQQRPFYKRPELIAGATSVVLVLVAITGFGLAASDDGPPNRTGLPGEFK